MKLRFLATGLLLLTAAACNPKTTPDAGPSVAEKLKSTYENGEISRCTLEGATYYVCARNAPDAGSEIFDSEGKKVGACYYNTGAVDALCDKLTTCEVIYRVSPNIWGKPGVSLAP